MTPEAKVKAAIKAIFVKNKVWFCMPAASGYGPVGLPDFVACCRGRLVAVEAKAGKGTLTKLQAITLDGIKLSGGVTYVVNENSLYQLALDIAFLCKEEEPREVNRPA